MYILQVCYNGDEELHGLRAPSRVLASFFFLHILHSSLSKCSNVKAWKLRTGHFVGVSLMHLQRYFIEPFVTYALIHPKQGSIGKHGQVLQTKAAYVGSTTVGLHSRQDNRWRKMKLLERGIHVNAEVVLHYFHTRGVLHEVLLIPISIASGTIPVRARECELIQVWQPRYNHPWIYKLHPTSTHRTTRVSCFTSQFTYKSRRLWQKVRRRLSTLKILQCYAHSNTNVTSSWKFLMDLAAGGELSFRTSSILRSSQFSALHIYALLRMSNHLDDPPRSLVRSLLKKNLQFRQAALPKAPRPLVLPLLAHASFQSAARRFVSDLIYKSREFLVPFHLPSKKIVAGKHHSVQSLLYNHLAMMRTWTFDQPPQCQCRGLKREHPQLQCVNGHVASPAAKLNVSKRLHSLLLHSSSSQVYMNQQTYLGKTCSVLQAWCTRNGIHNLDIQDWTTFIYQQWPLHVQSSWHTVKFKDVAFLKNIMKNMVVHGRDHALGQIHVFCPVAYWTTLRSTFCDPLVYRPVSMSYAQTQQFLVQLSKQSFLKKYKWGINNDATLPIAYVLLKAKKDYKVARPIISYKYFIFAKLFRAAAIVLDLLQREVLPCSFGLQTFPAMMTTLRQWLETISDDVQLTTVNQDLVGFFTSVPVERILHAINWVTEKFVELNGVDCSNYSFTVSLREKDVKLRVWRGKPRKAGARHYSIFIKDLVDICKLSCDTSFFVVGGQVYAQCRGAAIGNQISPILANISIAFLEEHWVHQNYQFLQHVQHRFLCLRYVDNRVVILDKTLLHHPRLRTFLHDNFYIPPVQLERVKVPYAQCEFLGFDIRTDPIPSIAMILHRDDWRYRLPSSGGTQAQKSALYNSRKHSILKYVWPKTLREQQLFHLQKDHDARLVSSG